MFLKVIQGQIQPLYNKNLSPHFNSPFCQGLIFSFGPEAPGCLERCVNCAEIFSFIILNVLVTINAAGLRLRATLTNRPVEVRSVLQTP